MTQYEKMTGTKIPGLVISLAIPTTISMLITSLYNLADTAFVGQLGNASTGAIGVAFSFMTVLQSFGFLNGHGGGINASVALGRQDNEKANRYASSAFCGSFFLGLLFAVLGLVFLEPLVYLLGSTETIAPLAESYLRNILVAGPFVTTSFTMNNMLRYEGKAKLGTVGMMVGAVLNVGLDPVFIFVFHMGVAGAGLATAISQCISFSILLFMFLSGRSSLRLSLRLVSTDVHDWINIFTTGLPSLLRQGLASLSAMLLNNYAAAYGDAAVAAMSVVTRVSMVIFSVSLGIGQGFQPVSSYNYGAKLYSRVREAFRFTLIASLIFMFIVSSTIMLLAPSVIALFRNDPDVITIGTRALRLYCFSLYFMPITMCTEMQLQSTGQKASASLLASMRGGLLFIPLLIVLSSLRGLSGLQEAQPLAYLLMIPIAVVFGVRFFRRLPEEEHEL